MSRNGLPVELQVFYGFLFINNHAQGCDADFNMLLYIILGHQIVAFIGFYTFRNHRGLKPAEELPWEYDWQNRS